MVSRTCSYGSKSFITLTSLSFSCNVCSFIPRYCEYPYFWFPWAIWSTRLLWDRTAWRLVEFVGCGLCCIIFIGWSAGIEAMYNMYSSHSTSISMNFCKSNRSTPALTRSLVWLPNLTVPAYCCSRQDRLFIWGQSSKKTIGGVYWWGPLTGGTLSTVETGRVFSFLRFFGTGCVWYQRVWGYFREGLFCPEPANPSHCVLPVPIVLSLLRGRG